jgi:hypothetical protein
MYTRGELIITLGQAGLQVEWLHECDWLFYQLSAEQHCPEEERCYFAEYRSQLPFTSSLKAVIR